MAALNVPSMYQECVELLLAHGANIRAPNSIFYHLLPLPIAIVFNQFEIARMLLEHDQTIINCAYTHKYGREFDVGDKTPLQLIAVSGEDKWLQFILSYHPDPDLISLAGKTALDYAKENEHEHCVTLLYEYMIEREFRLSPVFL